MTVALKPPRQKTCANPSCAAKYTPRRLGQSVCSPACALAVAPKHQDKARKAIADRERREIKVRKERLKSRADHLREAQAVVNRYVRLRDAHLGCVSCDLPAGWGGQWHCSHYRSVGAAPHLRFNLWNMNKSCSACNNFLSGNIIAYRVRLIEKIGLERVELLESCQARAGHDIPYLKRLKAIFAKKVRRIERKLEDRQSWKAM